MKKIISIVGARPQFVKAAVVSRQLRQMPMLSEKILHTGQHYDREMSDIFFREMGLPEPNWNLAIGSESHGHQTARMLMGIESVLIDESPDWLLVYGDTNSTLAGALAAAKLQIPVAHVEAGLRSYNRTMPEEINRVLTDHVSSLLFAPSEGARDTLVKEDIDLGKIQVPGDVMYDAAQSFLPIAEKRESLLSSLSLMPGDYALVTIHRAENTDTLSRLKELWNCLCDAASSVPLIMPLHPRTRAALKNANLSIESKGLHLLPPVGYLEMLALLKNARAVVTDSGGLQKEAFFLRIPCATIRSETEWKELVDWGWNRLMPCPTTNELLSFLRECPPGDFPDKNAYGGGMASKRIAESLADFQTE